MFGGKSQLLTEYDVLVACMLGNLHRLELSGGFAQGKVGRYGRPQEGEGGEKVIDHMR